MNSLMLENAALVALLQSNDDKHRSWSSIANDVSRNGSALRVLNHEMDPIHNPLIDEPNSEDYETSLTLFGEGDIPPSPERKKELHTAFVAAQREVNEWADRGLDFVSVLDERYPNRLRQIVDMPPFLFADGILKQDELGVSVVGSRHATPEALAFASDVTSMLVRERFAVIAGLASGIDTTAHRRAISEGGRTVAFIGTGITRQYPVENRVLQQEIGEKGLVLSQFWPEQGPTRYTFPMRNASMSGYGVATIVVQAGEHSGTRIQARQAQQHGRPVILCDRVVNETKWGHELVGRPGVHVVSTVEDIRRLLRTILNMGAMLDDSIDQLIAMETKQ